MTTKLKAPFRVIVRWYGKWRSVKEWRLQSYEGDGYSMAGQLILREEHYRPKVRP